MGKTGGAIIALCCKNGRLNLKSRKGACIFCGLENLDDQYVESTYKLKPQSIQPTDTLDVYNVVFNIERIGDLAHTFILKTLSPVKVDDWFNEFKFQGISTSTSGEEKINYCQGMTLKTNNSLARASGWLPLPIFGDPYGVPLEMVSSTLFTERFSLMRQSTPLMVRETVDYKNQYLPLLNVGGDNETLVKNILTVYGVKGKEIAEGLNLEVTYVYLDRVARRGMAQTFPALQEFLSCNYVTNIYSVTSKEQVLTIDKKEKTSLCSVSGLLLHPQNGLVIDSITFTINGRLFYTWDSSDKENVWIKVGLTDPKDGSILLPFSRNMWECPSQIGSLDFERFDDIKLHIKCSNVPDQIAFLEITALAYDYRMIYNSIFCII